VPPRIQAYLSGLPLLPELSQENDSGVPSFEFLEACLQLLDSYLLGQWMDEEEAAWDKTHFRSDATECSDGLIALVNAAHVLSCDKHTQARTSTCKCY
jgi:hypothetical protein